MRLVLAPQDIRTADPTAAEDIYAGVFSFAGKTVDVGGNSPFALDPPTDAWGRELHGFSWLRHLRAADTELSRSNARALVDEWLRTGRRLPALAWFPEVAARRLVAWLSQSAYLLEHSDPQFYERLMRAIGRHVDGLEAVAGRIADPLVRLSIRASLAAAAAAIDGRPRLARRAIRNLDDALATDILPDGGHVTRNPSALLEILVDLLPLRQALAVRGMAPPPRLPDTINRMMPMVRFFRHADGTFAHFNGVGTTPTGLVATVLAYDDVRGRPAHNARYSGYQRVEGADALVLMDTGCPPPLAASQYAHAGCLSFEFSDGPNRLIVNCGALQEARPEWRLAARATAAHSTVVIEDTSSARVAAAPHIVRALGPVLFDGPANVPVERDDSPERTVIVARHDGYRAQFGVIHERALSLSADGMQLSGRDRLILARPQSLTYAVRFHIHPAVRVTRTRSRNAALLTCGDGTVWRFVVDETHLLNLEESVYLSNQHGMRRSTQLVIHNNTANTDHVRWRLARQTPRAAAAAHQDG